MNPLPRHPNPAPRPSPRRRACYLAPLLLSLPIAGHASDLVSGWNQQTDSATATLGAPPVRARGYAMTQIAVHDALNAIEPRYQSYLCCLAGAPGASKTAAIATAAHDVLIDLLSRPPETPAKAAQRAAVQARRDADLAAIPDGAAKQSGIETGQAAAAAILQLRAQDGAASANFVLDPYPADPGIWVPTPVPPDQPPGTPGNNAPALLPGWGNVTPFALRYAAQYRPDAPAGMDLTSTRYAAEVNEIQGFGSLGANLTTEQRDIARFWYEASPSGWNRIARTVSAERALDDHDDARLYALVNIAMADGYIASWESKYTYMFWRPVTAIRRGDEDPNDATQGDPEWMSYLPTPNMPDVTSGHAVLGGAAAEVMADFFNNDAISFAMTSGAPYPGVHRAFTSFSQAADENSDSRVYAGIHFRTSCELGVKQGRKVGRFVLLHYLRPLR